MRIFTSNIPRNFKAFQPIFMNQRPCHLWRKIAQPFSESKENAILLDEAELHIRNSETLQLRFKELNESRKIQNLVEQFGTQDTLIAISNLFAEKFNAKNTRFYCEKGQLISRYTPIQVFLNRSFMILNPQAGYRVVVNGQLQGVKKDEARYEATTELQQNLRQLELPVIAQRQIQAYFNRVSIWLDAKYGTSSKTKLKQKEIQDILVQAIVDPQCHWNVINALQEEWFKKYVEIRQLREKKNEALRISEKSATRHMTLGLGMIAANIGFIWSGTYVFYSWDIIEPIAYFTSSLASIVLFSQFLKLKKPFSLENYRQYLINCYLPKASEQIGLNLSDLETKEMELQIVESLIKDYLIAKL